MSPSLAYFITPHGFGHATRASAVMAALHARQPDLRFEIFTQVPRWVFEVSLTGPFNYHALFTDVGLVQVSPLVEDLSATVEQLNALLPFDPAQVAALAEQIRQLKCAAVLCDIAPLGSAAARAAGVPSALIENFTWDWMYEAYADAAPGLRPHIAYLREQFAAADYHIQTTPVCLPAPEADLITRPVSRAPRTSPRAIRERLDIPLEAKTVHLTMGGIEPGEYGFLAQLNGQPDTYFVIPGGSQSGLERRGNARLLPHHSEFYHPDLLNACDAVVGKLGYSTLAEAYQAGLPYGYIPRERFRETAPLAAFVRAEMRGVEIPAAQFEEGRWLALLPDLLAEPRVERDGPNGAVEIAGFVAGLLAGG